MVKPVIRALEERVGSRQARLEKYFKSHRVKLPDKGWRRPSGGLEVSLL